MGSRVARSSGHTIRKREVSAMLNTYSTNTREVLSMRNDESHSGRKVVLELRSVPHVEKPF
jgi:hypothetical protein